MPRRIESHMLEGPVGPLEALLEEPEEGVLREACLVLHPHPLYGGTMHNKVVYRMARGMRRTGAVVLRFLFRGVGRSGGKHDHKAWAKWTTREPLSTGCGRAIRICPIRSPAFRSARAWRCSSDARCQAWSA